MPRRPMSEERRRELSEKAKARWAERQAAPTAVAEPEGDDPLAELMATLQKVQAKKTQGAQALEELGRVLDKIDPKEHPEIADNPVIEAFLEKIGAVRLKKAEKQGLPPGTYLGDPKSLNCQDVIWKLNDVNRREDGTKELITWTPAETIPIWYNGVFCQAVADTEMTTEKAFYDIYVEHRRMTREMEARKAYMFGRTNTPPPGEGVDGGGHVAAARVRAFMGMGGEGGGGRIILGYPGDARFELRDVPGGQGNEGVSGEATSQ